MPHMKVFLSFRECWDPGVARCGRYSWHLTLGGFPSMVLAWWSWLCKKQIVWIAWLSLRADAADPSLGCGSRFRAVRFAEWMRLKTNPRELVAFVRRRVSDLLHHLNFQAVFASGVSPRPARIDELVSLTFLGCMIWLARDFACGPTTKQDWLVHQCCANHFATSWCAWFDPIVWFLTNLKQECLLCSCSMFSSIGRTFQSSFTGYYHAVHFRCHQRRDHRK